MKVDKIDRFFSLLVFIVTFIIYFLTFSRSLYFTDSGELAAVSSTLGIAHPTGYPLYTIISYLWLQILPFDNITLLNLLSSLFCALSAAILYLILIQISFNCSSKTVDYKFPLQFSSALLAIGFGFTSIVWEQATTNEVYSLHFLMVNLFLYVLIKAYFAQSYKLFMISAFVLGLSLANHLTSILLIPVSVYTFFKKQEKGFDLSGNRIKQFVFLMISLAFALSLYLYLPIRSSMQPLFNWGFVSRGIDKFIYHISGKQYQVWMFSGFDAWKKNFNVFFDEVMGNIGILIVLIFLICLYYIFVEKNKVSAIFNFIFAPIALFFISLKQNKHFVFTFLTIAFLSCILYSFNYSIYDIQPYFYLAYLSLFIFLALPIIYYSSQIKKLFLGIYVFIPLFFVFYNYSEVDKHQDTTVVEYTKSIVDNLPQNSIIISAQWDYFCSAFWYLQQVKGYRKDVVMIEKELLRRTWYPYQLAKWYPEIVNLQSPEIQLYMKDLELFESGKQYDPISIQANYINVFVSIIENNIDKRDIFLTPEILLMEPHIARPYKQIPYGFAVKLSKQLDTLNYDNININYEKLNSLTQNKRYYLYDGLRLTIANNILAMMKYAQFIGDTTQSNMLSNYYNLFSKNETKQNF
ncbi:MAG TPA: DUF2723 domain-containing protein [Candidatus Kapabacteria bacterium]|nr:DUF2723 domain-containing protein [Candidatus Kapabacteria bacterium]